MGRETGSTHTYHAGILDFRYNLLRSQLTGSYQSLTTVDGLFPFIAFYIDKIAGFR